jgi:hypothetical protein
VDLPSFYHITTVGANQVARLARAAEETRGWFDTLAADPRPAGRATAGKVGVGLSQFGLVLFADVVAGQQACMRRLRVVIEPFGFAAVALLLFQHYRGQERVHIETQSCVQGIEELQLLWTVIAAATDGPTHHRLVLLFDVAVVILPLCSAPG